MVPCVYITDIANYEKKRSLGAWYRFMYYDPGP